LVTWAVLRVCPDSWREADLLHLIDEEIAMQHLREED
jgi:hypothetical protein